MMLQSGVFGAVLIFTMEAAIGSFVIGPVTGSGRGSPWEYQRQQLYGPLPPIDYSERASSRFS